MLDQDRKTFEESVIAHWPSSMAPIYTHAHTDSDKFSVTYKYYLGFLKAMGQLHQVSHADDDDDDGVLLRDDC